MHVLTQQVESSEMNMCDDGAGNLGGGANMFGCGGFGAGNSNMFGRGGSLSGGAGNSNMLGCGGDGAGWNEHQMIQNQRMRMGMGMGMWNPMMGMGSNEQSKNAKQEE